MKTCIVLLLCIGVALAARSKLRTLKKERQSRACTGDTINNCDSYGKSVCSNPDYTQWVSTHCCSYCGSGGSSSGGGDGGFQLIFATQAPSGGSMTGSCHDAINNCDAYGSDVCTNADYSQWAHQNCMAFCGLCGSTGHTGGTMPGGGGTMPSSGSCADAIPNCDAYGATVCTDPNYSGWVSTNCPKFCNKCSSGTMPGTGTMTGGTMPGTGTMTGGTMTGTCADASNSCALLDQSSHICSDSAAQRYAQQNCAKTCGLCGGGSMQTGGSTGMTSGTGGSMTGSTGTGSGTIMGTSSGCVYNGQAYSQGQTWKDGCKFTCTCVDGTTGKYQCTQLCVNWDLPPQCTMNPPAAGKCCPTPNCPTGFTIQYPDGYTEQ